MTAFKMDQMAHELTEPQCVKFLPILQHLERQDWSFTAAQSGFLFDSSAPLRFESPSGREEWSSQMQYFTKINKYMDSKR